jgi:hypothetical protein
LKVILRGKKNMDLQMTAVVEKQATNNNYRNNNNNNHNTSEKELQLKVVIATTGASEIHPLTSPLNPPNKIHYIREHV